MPTTKANQRAVAKYVKQNYDRIEVKVPKGQKAFIQTAADVQGESVNAFVAKAVEERIEQMKAHHATCPVCGTLLFRANNNGSPQVYCSATCRKQAFNMREREKEYGVQKEHQADTCLVCGIEMVRTGNRIKTYCSDNCRVKAYKARKQQENQL